MIDRHARGLLTVIGVLLLAPAAWAQAPAAAPATIATPGLPHGDISGNIGWFNQKGEAGEYERWHHESRWLGVEGGYYWTEHLKTEAGFAGTSEDEAWTSNEQVTFDRQPYWASRVEFLRSRRFYVTQLYQFEHNAWVHPFVGAGFQAVREERRGIQYLYGTATYGPRETVIPPTTETTLKASAVAGLKIYVSRRGFLRVDTLVNFTRVADEVVVRFGGGIDF